MALTELAAAARLERMYNSAPSNEKAVRVHLFGIKHAEDLAGLNLKTVVKAAGLGESYSTEVRKGMNLARYVTLKPGV